MKSLICGNEFRVFQITPSPFSMKSMKSTHSSSDGEDGWMRFCDESGRSAARRFLLDWRRFLLENPTTPTCAISPATLAAQFHTTFVTEFVKNYEEGAARETSPVTAVSPTRSEECASSTSAKAVSRVSRSFRRAFRSRSETRAPAMCTSMISTGTPTPNPASSSSCKRASWFRSKFPARTAIQVLREGLVRYMTGTDVDVGGWEKCRLSLVQTAGGALLEFYAPPKSAIAKTGIFCCLITEARETTALEMDGESGFVLRSFNGVEYVIEGKDGDDRRKWLHAIRLAMPELIVPNAMQVALRRRGPSAPPSSSLLIDSASTHCFNTSLDQPRTAPLPAMRVSLEQYPWFHGRLSRAAGARMVLTNGVDGHGLFLVRQSETRPGELVLTFNCKGRAKHVRIAINEEGECRVQHLAFPSILTLLHHFRAQPIPLDTTQCPSVTLTEFLICWRRRSSPLVGIDVRNFLTYSGSVCLDLRALEQLIAEHFGQFNTGTSRRASNTYHFS